MKQGMTLKLIAAMAVALTFAVRAQGPAEGGKGGGQGGPGGQPPPPAEIAKRMMEKFDADKNSKLSTEELTTALASRPRRGPPGGGQGGQAGQGGPGQGQGGQQGGEHKGPPSPDKIAAKMIEEFSSDKATLTEAELTKALEAHRPQRGQGGPGGQKHAPGAGT